MKTDNTNVEQLAKLGEEFRKTYETAQHSKLLLQAGFKKSTADAIACGMILIKAKKLAGHGAWLKWLNEHAKVSDKTAERYMHLARKSSSVTNLTTKSVTECYKDLGLIKDSTSKSKTPHQPKPKPSEFVQAKGLANRLWNLLIKTTDPDRMVQQIEAIILWHQNYLEQKQKRESALNDGFDVGDTTTTVVPVIEQQAQFECETCGETFKDDKDAVVLYECNDCGTRFTRETSANDNHQCPDCNKFGSKVSDCGCPSCNEGELEQVEIEQHADDSVELKEAA